MGLTKYASFEDAEVLDVKGSSARLHTASLDKLGDYQDYRTGDGYMYVRLRAISSRVNKNHDGWPSVELAGGPSIFDHYAKQSATGFTVEASDGDQNYGFATFLGKPNFIDHNNSDPKRARGVVVDAKLKVLPMEHFAGEDTYWGSQSMDPEHAPPTEVELLIEIDAQRFPKYAKAVRDSEIDGFSMGCDVESSKCSHCGHVATNPSEYCSHIIMKGAHHDYKTADGKHISRKSYENCYGIHFFEISAVFDPADETALAREVRAAMNNEGIPPRPGRPKGECPACRGTGRIHSGIEDEAQQSTADVLCSTCHGTGKTSSFHHTAENPLPQSFETSAPEEVDTMRQEHNCPVCGENMEGETCDVCGYVEPPKGLDNPDLQKAQELQQAQDIGSQNTVNQNLQGAEMGGGPPAPPEGQQAPHGGHGGPGAGAVNSLATAAVMGDMRWSPKLDAKTAAKINHLERPIKTGKKPATNDPAHPTVIKSPQRPVTSGMRTAQDLIAAAKNNHQGDTMSTKVADGPTPPGDTSADVRVDATGVGGVIDSSNEAASDATGSRGQDGAHAQVDVTGVGSTGVTDVGADSTESLPTAAEGSDDSGYNKDKTTEDSGPTATYGDSDGTEKGFTDGVTNESLEGNQNKDSAAHVGYDSKPFYDQPGLSGGSANQGTEPVDAVGKAGERVDVLQPATTPEKSTSGPTTTWHGTDGAPQGSSKVYKQQDPVTTEVSEVYHDGWTSHIVASLKLADLEVELGLTPKDEKYDRIAELEAWSGDNIGTRLDTLSQVKTAGMKRLASRQVKATRLPALFGQRTAAPEDGDERVQLEYDGEVSSEVTQDEESLDSALFSR